jgi:AmmeMemoRadiSam system protein B
MNPKLRAVDAQWIDQESQPRLLLRDRLGLTDQGVAFPGQLVDLLALMDGSRSLAGLQAAMELQTGIRLPMDALEKIVAQMDQTLLLDSPHFAQVYAKAVDEFRAAPCRPPALAGRGYPDDPAELAQMLDQYIELADDTIHPKPNDHELRGLVCPHIDYQRGGIVYAQVWERAKQAIREAELIIMLGTDHNSIDPWPTVTTQNYATPWGTIPTDQATVSAIAEAIGADKAFGNELHHRDEHSIELALVWAQRYAQNPTCKLVPLLCGSYHSFIKDGTTPQDDPISAAIVQAIRDASAGRRTFIVAAADLAHVGPAFGDTEPYGPVERATLANTDRTLIEGLCTGNPAAFFSPIIEVQDRFRVCGLAPIYLALRLLNAARGEAVAYQQCPADNEGSSLVSIAGVLLR